LQQFVQGGRKLWHHILTGHESLSFAQLPRQCAENYGVDLGDLNAIELTASRLEFLQLL